MTCTLTVTAPDRRRKRPLTEHKGLSPADARALKQIYLALGHLAQHIRITSEREGAAA